MNVLEFQLIPKHSSQRLADILGFCVQTIHGKNINTYAINIDKYTLITYFIYQL